jgi:hypothetical protein
MSPRTRSVIFEIVSRLMSVEYTSARCASTSPVVSPLAVSEITIESALALADRQRLERAVTVTWHVELNRADLGNHRLRTCPVATVATVSALCCVLRVADMVLHLDFEAGLEELLRQIGKQPTRAHQAPPVGPGLVDELALRVTVAASTRWAVPAVKPPPHHYWLY